MGSLPLPGPLTVDYAVRSWQNLARKIKFICKIVDILSTHRRRCNLTAVYLGSAQDFRVSEASMFKNFAKSFSIVGLLAARFCFSAYPVRVALIALITAIVLILMVRVLIKLGKAITYRSIAYFRGAFRLHWGHRSRSSL